MVVSKRIVLHFPKRMGDRPIIYRLIKDYDLEFNILKALITPEDEGLMVLALGLGCLGFWRYVTVQGERRSALDVPRAVHLLVAGFGRMGQSVALHAAKIGHYANGEKLRITVIDKDAGERKNRSTTGIRSLITFAKPSS